MNTSGEYGLMARIRAFEEVVAKAHADGRLPGLLHLSIGGEAVAAGVVGGLGSDDRVYSTHRGHGHFLAAGEDPVAMMAELAGRAAGLCRGRGGSMHLMGHRAVLATGIVGGTLPIAVGHALALPTDAVAVAFFGDGAAQSGVFHESMNLASLWGARVLFVCENNGWAEFTSREEHTNVRNVSDYGDLFGLKTEIVDGGDVRAVRAATERLIAPVRAGHGPALLECHVARLRSHYEGDLRKSDDANARDPLDTEAQQLVAGEVSSDTISAIREAADEEMRSAFEEALRGSAPFAADDAAMVFARAL